MKSRLAALGVTGVNTRTFHSAAYAQLRYLSTEPIGEVMASKATLLRPIAAGLPPPFRFRPVSDLATEIEWARNRRVPPAGYLDSLEEHRPPIRPHQMAGVYREYERRKRRRNLLDFEDLLELAIRMFDTDSNALTTFRERYSAFTVDEFQDVNLLQYTLLDRWLGDRDELCAVGDDYQSIYGFTGATPRYLLELPRRYLSANVIRLETNYRSTPQILDVANRLVPSLGGARKSLRPSVEPGPSPTTTTFSDEGDEARFVATRVGELNEEGVPYESIAVLYRIGFRSESFAESLGAAGIPYQVRDGAFITRLAARRVIASFRSSSRTDVATQVHQAAVREGWREPVSDDLSEQEMTRQRDLARLVRLAEEFTDGRRTAAEFVADLQRRFSPEGEGRGVNLLTYHRAKGLEFDAVVISGLEEGVFPHSRSLEEQGLEEERRLCYVGLTRAKERLVLTHAAARSLWGSRGYNLPSRFLDELPQDEIERDRLRPSSWSGYGSPTVTPRRSFPELSTGDSVRHSTLGEGVVTRIEGDGVVTVRFADDGVERRLMLEYAPLERIA
jgi:DNA helicase-2/ATP-dependent DNA helicase PcrA